MTGTDIDVGKLSRAAMNRLRWRLRATRAALVIERGARAFWPLLSLTLAALGALRIGLPEGIPPTWAMAGAGTVGALWLVLFGLGVRRFHWPTMAEARDRMDATLPGRPLQTLEDRQAIGGEDVGTRYLWARHLQRMAEQAAQSRAARPVVRLARSDPWAVRLIAILIFVGALIFGRSDPVQSLVETIQPPAPVVATGPSWEGWAEPPAYTGKPSVYLNDVAGETLTLPQGTRVTLRVYGATQDAALTENVTQTADVAFPAEPQTEGLAEVNFAISKSGIVTLTPPGGAEARFTITMVADAPPTVTANGEISRSVQGEFQMPFRAQDDYGVIGGEVTITLALEDVDRRYGLALDPEPRAPVTFDMPLPFSRDTTDFEETVVEDLAEHPWAGLPVVITLTATDDLSQEGSYDTGVTPLPGKRFFDTTAGAVAEMRRDLLWNRANAKRVTRILKAITWNPEVGWESKPEKAYLMVRTAIRRMQYHDDRPLSDKTRDELADLLWRAALLIEDGDVADARERLKRAQERLAEAMRNGATDEEIQQLMDELRRATQDYMRQLAEEQRRNGEQRNQQAGNQNQQTITQDQLQELMDRIQELMEQGRMDEAQQLMQQLQQMMENMQIAEGNQGGGNPNGEAMEGLGDTLEEQQDLADETFRQLQEEFNRNRRGAQSRGQEGQDPPLGRDNRNREQQQQGEGGEGQQREAERGQGQGNQLSREQLAERQRALRDMLNEQRRQFEENGVEGGDDFAGQLDEAERQMGRAEEELRQGNSDEALNRQADAMEALREGMRQLNEAQRRAQNEEGGQQGQQAGQPGRQRRDPLGRPLSENGEIGTDERLVPGEEAWRRSREVMDEIRRRSGDRTRPQVELDYLERLLDRF